MPSKLALTSTGPTPSSRASARPRPMSKPVNSSPSPMQTAEGDAASVPIRSSATGPDACER